MGNNTKKYKELFDTIHSNRGITDIWGKVLDMLCNDLKYPDGILYLLCIYFSFIDDGNICIKLDTEALYSKWTEKWNMLVFENDEIEENPVDKTILDKGIKELLDGDNANKLEKLFVVEEINGIKWLYSQKYHDAKTAIQERFAKLFPKESDRPWSLCESVLNPKTRKDKDQTNAVEKGLKENLFVSGGPGMGKTTVAFDIVKSVLFNLEAANDLDNWNLYLTAPTGKAADRLKESFNDCLNDPDDTSLPADSPIRKRLEEAESFTIHSLLKYSPAENKFTYNEKNPFPEKSIFVIDEASMIDICLFASLLKAIPDNAIVFILGDQNQLPSVDAGAVLGSVLEKVDNKVILRKSYRSNADITEAARLINAGDVDGFFKLDSKDLIIRSDVENDDKKLKEIVNNWAKDYFTIKDDMASAFTCENAEIVFEITERAKILCAERKGPRGVEGINKIVLEKFGHKTKTDGQDFFAGELLMITKNNKLLGLSNGDNGIVVKFKDDEPENLWFMIKKGVPDGGEEQNGIFTKNGYTYYPLYLIPSDSIEISYAMTIHKSQGSGYGDILIILPKKAGHPLLNRQILYTALTRSKNSVTIVASKDVISAGIGKKDERDTNIVM